MGPGEAAAGAAAVPAMTANESAATETIEAGRGRNIFELIEVTTATLRSPSKLPEDRK